MLPNKTTIALVDDHPIVMEGLARLLEKEENIHVAGRFTTGREFLDYLSDTSLHVVLLDITLPDISGIELCKKTKEIAPATIVLALSNHHNRGIIMEMLQNGASGYLLKNATLEELITCINEALNGQIAFSQAVKEIIAAPQLNSFRELARLTTREKEILGMLASGKTTTEMAAQLFISKHTIESHRKNLLQKFKAKNVAELIRAATQQGFL